MVDSMDPVFPFHWDDARCAEQRIPRTRKDFAAEYIAPAIGKKRLDDFIRRMSAVNSDGPD